VILGTVLGISLFLLMFASLYIYTEYKKGAEGKFGLFRQEVLAEDKLITEQFPNPKTREEIIQEEIAAEIHRQLLDEKLKQAQEAQRKMEEERKF
jgi:hypothetical protein